ncbi:pyruvate dehydrogenase complex dihydrolipoyllysine-residue acetyltransferase [Alteromonas sp. ASW11-130]|uniref:pyruvate dehydrogenase complex dihydrolipoyllysine-residue acetyltransferase n=1 Tax=Alteromonas sp. ASW11-130 TaxID=3015775 RepID=UPI002241C3D6|nr:pyruvate dehydrogenase complex dihydrolipoyllysine-residue acetyltransferase [Alteromonas sp. ASW11-130]MCW8091604.1 pyruvate dehydrogenase complex dihydrolipoyllysine-residue acetyltransferase [Alteromonas sp. ASW11-130]
MSNIKEVRVPDLGEEGVEVIELCLSAGDDVEQEGSLVTVESDKASMDIPAPFAGKLKELCVKVGDKISEGDLLAKIEVSDETDADNEDTSNEADESKEEPQAQEESKDQPRQEKAAAKSSGTGGTVEVKVPDIGDAAEVEIIEILVAIGDSVEAEDGLITLETDKATMDVPAPQAGKIKELKVNVGDKVSEGSLILLLESAGSEEDVAEEAQESAQADASSSASTGEEQEIEVSVPDIGDASDVDIIELLVAEGDTINAEDGLITLETDKATMDVPAPQGGTVTKLMVKQGDKVSQGSAILMLKVAGEAKSSSDEQPSASTASSRKAESTQDTSRPKPPPVPHHPSAGEKQKSGKVHASPSVRRLAREFGVDLTQVSGSGPKNRILKEDVQSYVKYELARPKATAGSVAQGEGGLQVIAPPKVDFAKFGEVEKKPLTRIQKISGPNLHRNWVTIPHVTQFEEADITDLEAFRKDQNAVAEKRKLGIKITPLVFMMKAVADALKAYPIFNTSLSADGESLIQKKYYHIGIAVDTPGGLVVPVVRDVDQKGIHELSKELMEISIKARDGKLKSADMQGSCFTISSLGGIGGTAFTPIVNAPDVAILGVSKSDMKPKWNGTEFEPRLMLPLSLSYDHRVIDGAVAARFAVHLKQVLEDLRQILL